MQIVSSCIAHTHTCCTLRCACVFVRPCVCASLCLCAFVCQYNLAKLNFDTLFDCVLHQKLCKVLLRPSLPPLACSALARSFKRHLQFPFWHAFACFTLCCCFRCGIPCTNFTLRGGSGSCNAISGFNLSGGWRWRWLKPTLTLNLPHVERHTPHAAAAWLWLCMFPLLHLEHTSRACTWIRVFLFSVH